MKHLKLTFILVMASCSGIMAQPPDHSVIATQGGVSQTGNISLEWTLGEVATSIIKTPNGLITEGFNQPWLTYSEATPEGFKKPGIASPVGDFTIKFAPNPVKTILYLSMQSQEEKQVIIRLMDLRGKLLSNQTVNSVFDQLEINMSNYPAAMYLMSFSTKEGQPIATYKIIKTH